ncbi:putative lipoprotein [Yersinia rohdei]|nr:putative lipoprotein [Yersinia rohdei]
MNMAIIAGKTRFIFLMLVMIFTLSGCGLTQKVSDGTVAVTKSIFYKQVKILHLDIKARDAVNNNAAGAPLATVVRIYQLRDRKTFDGSDYPSLFAEDSQAIKADLVAEKDIRIRPGAAVTIDVPLDEKTEYVAVAGMFLTPDIVNNTWRVVLSRDDLDPDKARQIELNNHGMTLLPLKDK